MWCGRIAQWHNVVVLLVHCPAPLHPSLAFVLRVRGTLRPPPPLVRHHGSGASIGSACVSLLLVQLHQPSPNISNPLPIRSSHPHGHPHGQPMVRVLDDTSNPPLPTAHLFLTPVAAETLLSMDTTVSVTANADASTTGRSHGHRTEAHIIKNAACNHMQPMRGTHR